MNRENSNFAIGVFDSGMGGISVLRDIAQVMPNERYIYYGDSGNAPYGVKDKEQIVKLSIDVCEFLVGKGVKAIVVACNTATSAAIKILRAKYDIPIIGMEPAVKPALSISGDKKTIVLATPITLKEKKFEQLLIKLNAKDKVYKIPAPKLVELVEQGKVKGDEIEEALREYIGEVDPNTVGAIVLGCTHFVFLRDTLKKIVGNIPIIDGNSGTANHLKDILSKNDMLMNREANKVNVDFYNSSNDKRMLDLSHRLFQIGLENKVIITNE